MAMNVLVSCSLQMHFLNLFLDIVALMIYYFICNVYLLKN